MKSSVVRLKRQGSYLEALEAFRSGDARLCAELLEYSRAPKAILLRVRALRRLGSLEQAHDLLIDLKDLDLKPFDEAQCTILRCAVLYERGSRQEAAALEVAALDQCRALGSAVLEAELAFFTTILERRLDNVRQTVKRITALLDVEDPTAGNSSYPFTLKYWLARITEIAAHALSVLGDRQRELESMTAAMRLFDESGVRDDFAEVQMLANVAETGLLLGAETVANIIAPRLPKFAANKDYDVELCRLVVTLAEVYAIDGNRVEALKLLRRLSAVSLETDMQLRVHMALADLLQDSGEPLSAQEILERGVDLALSVTWDASAKERSTDALLSLAARVSSFDVDVAERLMNLHGEPTSGSSTRFVLTSGLDPKADKSAAYGFISCARGNLDEAVLHFREARRLYEIAGNVVQQSRIEYELANLTFETQYLEATESWASEHPRSSLAAKAKSLRDERSRYDECVRLFLAGEFVECVEKIGASSRTAFRLLRLEALTRLRDFESFKTESAALRSKPLLLSDDLELRSLSLMGRISIQNLNGFDEEYAKAIRRCGDRSTSAMKAKLMLWSVWRGVLQKNYDQALAEVETILELCDESDSTDTRSIYSLEYLKVRALEAQSFIFFGKGDFDRAIRSVEEALAKYDSQQTKSAVFEGLLISNLSGSAWAVGLDRVQDLVLARAQSIAWTDALALHETRIYTNFADVCISEGNYLGAKRFLKYCRNDDVRSKIRVLITNAYLARDNGAYQTYRSSLYEASQLFLEHDWTRDGVNDYFLPLAQAVAPVNLALAKSILDRLDRLMDADRHRFLDAHDSFRLSMAKGIVSRVELDFVTAEAYFRSAFSSIADVDVAGHCLAQAAIELAELTKESRFVDLCTAYAHRFPSSEIARRTSQLTSALKPLDEVDVDARIAKANDLFDRGMFAKCVESLENSNGTLAILAKVRARLRLGEVSGSLSELELVLARDLAPGERALAMFFQFVVSMIEHGGENSPLFNDVEQYCLSNRCYDTLAWLYLTEAGRAIGTGDISLAQKMLASVSEIVELFEGQPSTVLGRSLGFYQAQAMNLRSMICQRNGNDAAGLEQFRRFFDEYDRSGERDDHFASLVVANVAALAISLGESAVKDLFAERCNKIEWHEELQATKCRAFVYLAEANAIAGDQVNALRHLRQLVAMPHSSAYKVRLLVTEAIVYRDSGNTRIASDLLREAVDFANSIEWTQCDTLSKTQLLILAEQLALTDPGEAQRVLALFDEVGENVISAGGVLIRSNRQIASELATRGVVAKANGSLGEAKRYFKEAYDLTSMLLQNFERMTAFLALELAELTSEAGYMDVARRYLSAHPDSDLIRKLPETTAAALAPKHVAREVSGPKSATIAS